MKPSSKPNKAQEDWREYLRSTGCIYGYPGIVQIHHPIGREGKHNSIHIGHWPVIPVSERAHRNIEKLPKVEQVRIYLKEVLEPYWRRFDELPMSADELMAIATWSR